MPALSHLKLAALMLVLLSGGCMTGCGSVRWERDYQRGMRRAISEQRRALVQFHSGFNGDCAGMDFDVFSEAKVQEMMQGFVPIRLEMLLNRELARRFDIEQVPAFVIIRPDGTVAGTHAGKLNEEMFRVFLIKHRYN